MSEDPRRPWARDGGAEPIFDLPTPLTLLLLFLVGIQGLRVWWSTGTDVMVMATFAFVPARYVLEAGVPVWPGGWGALVWSPFSYAFLHDGWAHLAFNAAMLAAIGRVVWARLGSVRFAALFLFTAVAGALVQWAVDPGSEIPTIGASGVAMGLLGAMLRFVFSGVRAPLMPLRRSVAHPRVQSFVGALVLMNVVLVVLGSAPFGGSGGGIAWAVHLGGFLGGFLGLPLFDPYRAGRRSTRLG